MLELVDEDGSLLRKSVCKRNRKLEENIMLLAIDVSNTNMVFGLYDGDKQHFVRISHQF